jgi:ABC-type antimicrobial peptide transport system permease subunit
MKLLTELKEGAGISWNAIRANKMRSCLTTLGIVIGVVTVTLLGTAVEGLNKAFLTNISFIGADVLYLSRFDWFTDSHEDWMKMQKRRQIPYLQVVALEKKLTLARAVAPVTDTQESINYKKRRSDSVRIVGTTDQLLFTSGFGMAEGRFLSPPEAQGGRPVCVLGCEVATNLFERASALGKKVQIGGRDFEVVGVIEKQGSFLGMMSLDNQAFIPLKQFMSSFWSNPDCEIHVKAKDILFLDEAKEELRLAMRTVRRLAPNEPDDFSINQQEQFVKVFRKLGGNYRRGRLVRDWAFLVRRRHWNHEHHVRLRRRAHQGDWHSQSHRCETPHDSSAVPARGCGDLLDWWSHCPGHCLADDLGYSKVHAGDVVAAHRWDCVVGFPDHRSPFGLFPGVARSANGPCRCPKERVSTRRGNILMAEARESFFMAINAVAAHKLRSALTLLGVLVGVFSIIVVMTAMRVMQSDIEHEMSQLGSQSFMIRKWPAIYFGGPDGFEKYWRRKDITFAQGMRLQERATMPTSIGLESVFWGGQVETRFKKTAPTVQLFGETPGSFPSRNWSIQEGRSLQDADVENARDVCVLGTRPCEKCVPSWLRGR